MNLTRESNHCIKYKKLTVSLNENKAKKKKTNERAIYDEHLISAVGKSAVGNQVAVYLTEV